MTHKAKAQSLVDEVFTTYDRERPWEERLVEAIAGALEAERREALEEAELISLRMRDGYQSAMKGMKAHMLARGVGMEMAAESVAKAIRAIPRALLPAPPSQQKEPT